MSAFRVVIPARYASSRLPGKPLRLLAGRPMLEHVCNAARASSAAELVVATDDQRIAAAARSLGVAVSMTATDHASGTDRIAEVARLRGWADDDVVVNVQCDEPMLPPALIDQVAQTLSAAGDLATLATPFTDDERIDDINVVKVVVDANGRALYFSRAPIPLHRENPGSTEGALRHIGLYAYRVGALRSLCALDPCAIEQYERLEQLRALWAGMRIDVAVASASPGPGVDTEADLVRVDALMRGAQRDQGHPV